MTIIELNKIEKVLYERKEKTQNAADLLRDTMRKKYCEDGGCWYRNKMNDSELITLDNVEQEANEAKDIYYSFIKHNWQ